MQPSYPITCLVRSLSPQCLAPCTRPQRVIPSRSGQGKKKENKREVKKKRLADISDWIENTILQEVGSCWISALQGAGLLGYGISLKLLEPTLP